MAFLGTFWKTLTEKLHFFGARSPLKTRVKIGARGAFRKVLESVSQKLISQNIIKGSAGDRILERGGEEEAALHSFRHKNNDHNRPIVSDAQTIFDIFILSLRIQSYFSLSGL